MLKDSLLVDTSFRQFDEMLRCERSDEDGNYPTKIGILD